MQNTHKQNESVIPFNYAVESNPNSHAYGRSYWGASLRDGRELMFHADKVVITPNGDLLAVSNSRLGANGEYVHLDESRTLLSIAAGEWTSYFGASVMTGDPVVVDHIVKPK